MTACRIFHYRKERSMKKTIVIAAIGAALLCGVAAQGQEVKIKKGKVKFGSKKLNKRYAKKYKKIFTKKNCGKKVKVK